MSDEEDPLPPPPPLYFGLAGAGIFSVAAWTSSICVAALLLGWASVSTSLAVGAAVGFGGIGTLLARRLPAPADQRIGLRGFALTLLPALLLLVPAALLASEIDNLVKAFWPVEGLAPELAAGAVGPDAALAPGVSPTDPSEGADPGPARPNPGGAPGPWLLVEAIVAMVLLRPVVEEFFFRGVILQGLVERNGRLLGVLGTAALSALCDAGFNLPLGSAIAVSALAQGLFQGALLGWVRLATGSLLAPIGLQIMTRGIGGASLLLSESLAIPGFNGPGDHTPPEFLVPAALCVALGVIGLGRVSRGAGAGESRDPERFPPTEG